MEKYAIIVFVVFLFLTGGPFFVIWAYSFLYPEKHIIFQEECVPEKNRRENKVREASIIFYLVGSAFLSACFAMACYLKDMGQYNKQYSNTHKREEVV